MDREGVLSGIAALSYIVRKPLLEMLAQEALRARIERSVEVRALVGSLRVIPDSERVGDLIAFLESRALHLSKKKKHELNDLCWEIFRGVLEAVLWQPYLSRIIPTWVEE